MPDMDGISALKKILDFDSQARIVMCSSLGYESMVNEAMQTGAKAYIAKPFKAQFVLDTVRKVLVE